MKIFNQQQEKMAELILQNNHIMPLDKLYSSEIQDLAINWAYYSGKIEGNTYTLIETELLLKSDVTSEKKYNDAKMLKNLYNAFISEIEHIKKGNREIINRDFILKLHSYIIDNLVSAKEQGLFRTRPVKISGTDYAPPSNSFEIENRFSEIMLQQSKIENPLERAIFLHCNIAKLQPFIDGNKRTSRLVESIVLMSENIVPVYSSKNDDIKQYLEAILHFYETGDYNLYTDYFLTKKIEYLQYFTSENLSEKLKRID
ncbi:MAG: Fic family protein [Cruoricaptor ignavus]|nr:Fic family protein [Cruoricaptor ignavus]